MSEPLERADVWLARESPDPEIVVVGVPWAADFPGMALTPLAMRDRLGRFSTFQAERDVDFSGIGVLDAGNWAVEGLAEEELRAELSRRRPALGAVPYCLFVGGDPAISGPLAESAGEGSKAGVIRFGSGPLADWSADGLEGTEVVLIGAHTFAASAAATKASLESGASSITAAQIYKEGTRMTIDRVLGKLAMCETIHVSVDLGVLDRAQAPGAVGALPGGMTARQLGDAVRRCGASGKVGSMDFVGADPEADPSGLTTDVVCHLLLSAIAGHVERMTGP